MKQKVTITTVDLKGFQVPVVIWPDGRTSFTYMLNDNNEVIFSTRHRGLGEDWTPISSSVPTYCTPRPYLPDGIIKTLNDYALIYFNDKKIIGVCYI